jgi:hypothetical protein
MTTSLAFHHSAHPSGATDPDIDCLADFLADFLVRNSGFIRGCGPNPTFLAT